MNTSPSSSVSDSSGYFYYPIFEIPTTDPHGVFNIPNINPSDLTTDKIKNDIEKYNQRYCKTDHYKLAYQFKELLRKAVFSKNEVKRINVENKKILPLLYKAFTGLNKEEQASDVYATFPYLYHPSDLDKVLFPELFFRISQFSNLEPKISLIWNGISSKKPDNPLFSSFFFSTKNIP